LRGLDDDFFVSDVQDRVGVGAGGASRGKRMFF
jgi:hypothetical protein